jgi:hypothetical protein
MKQLDSLWADFREIWYWGVVLKCVVPLQFSLHPDKNKGIFKLLYVYISAGIYSATRWILIWTMNASNKRLLRRRIHLAHNKIFHISCGSSMHLFKNSDTQSSSVVSWTHTDIPSLFFFQWLYSPCGPWTLFRFPDLFTGGRTPWTSDQLVVIQVS